MASIVIQINLFFLLISISSPVNWIKKINKCISETFFFYFSYNLGDCFAVIGDSSRTPYISSNIAHGIKVSATYKSLRCPSGRDILFLRKFSVYVKFKLLLYPISIFTKLELH